VGKQFVEHGAAFIVGQADDARGEVLADEQGAAPVSGYAHDGMGDGLDFIDLRLRQGGPPRLRRRNSSYWLK
jgi:hypothetical protein